MSERLTVELPDELVRQIRATALQTQRSFDDVLAEWIRRGGSEPVLELLSDEELLAVCDSQLATSDEEELGGLLEDNREARLDTDGRRRLDELMRIYRAALVRKSQAIKIAVDRHLRQRLTSPTSP
jgi:hypothetical protein